MNGTTVREDMVRTVEDVCGERAVPDPVRREMVQAVEARDRQWLDRVWSRL